MLHLPQIRPSDTVASILTLSRSLSLPDATPRFTIRPALLHNAYTSIEFVTSPYLPKEIKRRVVIHALHCQYIRYISHTVISLVTFFYSTREREIDSLGLPGRSHLQSLLHLSYRAQQSRYTSLLPPLSLHSHRLHYTLPTQELVKICPHHRRSRTFPA